MYNVIVTLPLQNTCSSFKDFNMNLTFSLPAPVIPPAQPHWVASFLPHLNHEAASAAFQNLLPAEGMLLDPFGQWPELAVGMVRPFRGVVTASGNPVLGFLHRLAARRPESVVFREALAALATARKAGERLELHIRRHYSSRCVTCNRPVTVSAYLWGQGASVPHAKIYRCRHCGTHGEFPITTEDLAPLEELARSAPAYRARILQRVTPAHSPLRKAAEQALEHYPPRALYVLSTLLAHSAQLTLPPEQRAALDALLLQACEQGLNLHPHPPRERRAAENKMPSVYREVNLWEALEAALPPEKPEPPQYPVSESPKAGAFYLHPAALRDLTDEVRFDGAFGLAPAPEGLFWRLSALWSGWLWGQSATASFDYGLKRQRFGWRWHTEALTATLRHVQQRLQPQAPLCLFIPADEEHIRAVLLAADLAGFQLENLALDESRRLLTAVWRPHQLPPDRVTLPTGQRLRAVAAEAQRAIGQPVSRRWLRTAVLGIQSRRAGLGGLQDEPTEVWQRWEERLESLDGIPFSGDDPLDERVERTLVHWLQTETLPDDESLFRRLHVAFPGLLTPDEAWVMAVLESYAERNESGWQIRAADRAAARRGDLTEIAALLEATGRRLGFAVTRQDSPLRFVHWEGEGGGRFWLSASTVIQAIVAAASQSAGPHHLVLPGGRSRLLLVRQKRNPQLAAALQDWRIIKFRLVRHLAALPHLTHEMLAEWLAADPPEDAPNQLPLL